MKTVRTASFRWQITCAILLIIVSVLTAVVFELKLRLADADQTSMRMCNELGRLVAHTRLPKQYIYTVPEAICRVCGGRFSGWTGFLRISASLDTVL